MPIIARQNIPPKLIGSSDGSGVGAAISVPTGTLDGHMMIAVIGYTTGTAPTDPAGWTTALTYDDGLTAFKVETRRASSEPASYSWTVQNSRVVIATFSGTQGVLLGSGQNTDTAPAITLSIPNSVVLYIHRTRATGGAFTSMPSGFDILRESASNANNSVSIHYKIFASSGSTGTVSGTFSGGSNSASVLAGLSPYHY